MTTSFWVHSIDPVLISIGPLPIRWYGLMYIIGFFCAMAILLYRQKRGLLNLPSPQAVQDLLFYSFLGGLIGGRLGACLLYEPILYLSHPLAILKVWEGGMSSHGGFIGAVLGMMLFARRMNVSLVHLLDNAVIAGTPGLGFGRIGNFINGELWGTVSDVPWAVVFSHVDPSPRHPVQLYQALTEGFLLFTILWFVGLKSRRKGLLSGLFCVLYSLGRIVTENVRAETAVLAGPDWLGLTKGQIYSVLLLVIGVVFLVYSARQPVAEPRRR